MIICTDETTTKNIKKITGREYLVKLLEGQNVDTIFGYPGTPILPIYDALSGSKKIKHYLARHEQGAIHMAEGYAKVKNKCGVVLVTSGAGFTNTLTGIMNAYSDNTPLVVISGQSETSDENEFQNIDIVELTKNCTKKTFSVKKPDDIEKAIKTAFTEAMKYPKAPCVIGITKSALEKLTEDRERYEIKQEIKVEAPHSCVLKALSTIKCAKRPLIIAGGGCTDAEQELREFAQLTHIPVVNTLMATGCADDISFGMIGVNGDSYLNEIIKKSDIVLALGTKFTNRTANNAEQFLPNAKIISVNTKHNKSQNIVIEKEIIGEMNIILQQMIGTIKSKNISFSIHYDWINSLTSDEITIKPEVTENTTDLTSEYVLNEIYNYTKKYYPIITTDVGEHQINTIKYLKRNSSKNFLTSGGIGTMGYGLPAAIGAYIAKPNSLVINITGDGSFQMNMQELGMCAEYNIGLKIVIMNNSALGMIKSLQQKTYNRTSNSDIVNPDFVKLAQAYGITGVRIKTKEELKSALKGMFNSEKTVILDIKIG